MAHKVDCSMEDCEFMVQSGDQSEVIDMVQRHAREAHDASMAPDEIRGMMHETH